MTEAARVLRPGGRIVVQMPNQNSALGLLHRARRGFREGRSFEVRYWSSSELRRLFEAEVGPARVTVDAFFSLNAHATDLALLPAAERIVLRASLAVRRLSRRIPSLVALADSLLVEAIRAP